MGNCVSNCLTGKQCLLHALSILDQQSQAYFGPTFQTDDVTQAEHDAKRGKSSVTVQGGKEAYTMQEVAQHASTDSAWVVIHGKVYDLTKFLNFHPGGSDSVLNVAGQDGTEVFDSIHAYNLKKLTPYCIGVVVPDSTGSSQSGQRAPTLSRQQTGGDGSALDLVETASGPVALLGLGQKVELPLKSRTHVSPDTVLLRFALPSAEHRLGLHVGGHVLMHAVGPDGSEVTRPYTPVTLDCDRGIMDLLVKVYRANTHPSYPAGGKMSAVVDGLKVGQRVRFAGPAGRFKYLGRGKYTVGGQPPADGVLASLITLLAAGSGITPIYQVIRAVLEDTSDPTLLSLVYANRHEQDILLKDEIDRLAARFPGRLKVLYVLSKPPAGWKLGQTGHVNSALIADNCFVGGPGVLGLVCGPQGFVEHAVKPGLQALGYDNAHTIVF